MPKIFLDKAFVFVSLAAILLSGPLIIGFAEQVAGGASRPFSPWYFAFVGWATYGVLIGGFSRRRLKRRMASDGVPEELRAKYWRLRELLGMSLAYSPIVTFSLARMLLKMSIWYSAPWYVLGYILLFLWRPSAQLATPAAAG